MSVPTSRESDKFMLRLPEGMREKIKSAAEQNRRSMNAEIVDRLELSFGIDAFQSGIVGKPATPEGEAKARLYMVGQLKELLDKLVEIDEQHIKE